MARKQLPMDQVRRNTPQLTMSRRDDVALKWRTHVGCKRSAPNPLNAPQLKKNKKFHLNPTHKKEKTGTIPDLQEPVKVVTVDYHISISDSENQSKPDCSGPTEYSFLPKVDDSHLQNSWSTDLHPSDMHDNYMGVYSHLPDFLFAKGNKEEKLHLLYQNSQNYHSTELYQATRGASGLPDMPQHNTAENICSAMADNFNLLDSRPKNRTAEELKKHEEDSEAESPIDRWACQVCRKAAVSIAVLPCSHLCLCWDCDSVTDNCPVCGKPKEEVFYIRT